MAEKDQSVMVAALVAVVAIVGLVVQFGGASGALSADYGAAYQPTYPQLERGNCPSGYTATDIVCTGSEVDGRVDQQMCYRTGDLYCVKDTTVLGNSQAPSGYEGEARFIAREQDCYTTPADEDGNSYYLCG